MCNKDKLSAKNCYSFGDFVEIIDLLRSPEGCPWDREQTHESIRKNFIEETYEAVEAIDAKDTELLKEELGDVMLQVLLHAKIECEAGRFCIDDVIDGVCKKLVLRHPHVFGDISAKTSDRVMENWDAIKKAEKRQKSDTEVLLSVPRCLPALMRAVKVQQKASRAGFDWEEVSGAVDKLSEELEELKAAIAKGPGEGAEEELGDLIFSAVNVSRFIGAEPEEALTKATDKFVGRFSKVEKSAAKEGKRLKELSAAEADKLWEAAKTLE